MQNIHSCNNKFVKLRPVFDILNKKIIDIAPCEESHSTDEFMVPYFGHHGLKQFIKEKPIR